MVIPWSFFRYNDDKDDAAKDQLLSPPKYSDVVPKPKPRNARRKVADKTFDEYGKEQSKFDKDGAPVREKLPSVSTTDV